VQFSRLPTLTTMVCCKLKIRLTCLSNFSTCPCCSQPYQLLPCCVYRGAILQVEPGLSHCEVWLKYRHSRTECCCADMHESCRKDHFLIYYIIAQYVKFRSSKGSQIMKISKQWILFICVLNKTKITNFGTKINITLCYPLLLMQQQHHHHKFFFFVSLSDGVIVDFALPPKLFFCIVLSLWCVVDLPSHLIISSVSYLYGVVVEFALPPKFFFCIVLYGVIVDLPSRQLLCTLVSTCF